MLVFHHVVNDWCDDDVAELARTVRIINQRIEQRTADDVRQKRKRT